MIVAPEGFLEGYVGNENRTPGLTRERYARDAAETLDGPLMTHPRDLATELNVYLMTGFAERRGDEVLNSAVMFAPDGRVVLHYSKSHTMDDEPFNTKGSEVPQGCRRIVRTRVGRLWRVERPDDSASVPPKTASTWRSSIPGGHY